MRAISAFNFEAGMSTRVCFECTALRMRVSMSAIGSVMSLNLLTWVTLSWPVRTGGSADPSRRFSQWLPAAFRDARHVALERQLAEAEPAQRKLPDIGARTPAQAAAVAQPHLVFRRLCFLRNL